MDCTGGCAGQGEGSREPDGGVYGVTGRITAFSGPSSGHLEIQPCANASGASRGSGGQTRASRRPARPRHRAPGRPPPPSPPRRRAHRRSPVGRLAGQGAHHGLAGAVPEQVLALDADQHSRAGPSSPAGSTRPARPRTSAKGRPASLPWASSAAPASSSASAGRGDLSSLPCASVRPVWSSSTSTPAAPMAMSVWPVRHALPGGVGDHHADVGAGPLGDLAAQPAGAPSGSSGRSSTVPGATLDASTPAAARVSPVCCDSR